jgi:hypothetical protein
MRRCPENSKGYSTPVVARLWWVQVYWRVFALLDANSVKVQTHGPEINSLYIAFCRSILKRSGVTKVTLKDDPPK